MRIKMSGLNGDLFIFEEKILVKKSWFWTRVFLGNRVKGLEILYEDIESIGYKRGNHFSNGHLSLDLNRPGGNMVFKFRTINNPKALEIYWYIKDRIGLEQPPVVPQGPDEIRKYKELWDEGIISRREFEDKKDQILRG